MSAYQVLYRKWRPTAFSEVVGQSQVTKTIQNELRAGRLSHAYLFTGTRGTGKTTCAKILSKAVNCLNLKDGNPCCECEICKGIDDGTILDVIEIDAASNNGVDNIRDLRQEANFTPAKATYRVYIIDEVHMLTTGAFNALLKTLEEPPPHVIFILATTEVHKLPATILSRCQRFDFRRISLEDMSARLKYVAGEEHFQLSDEAAVLISRIADGALRDALSLLDRCAATGENTVDYDTVCLAAGLTNKEYLFKLADYISQRNVPEALELISELHVGSCDMERLCSELINYFRNIMIVKSVKEPRNLIICTDSELARYKDQADSLTLESVFHCLSALEITAQNIKRGFDRKTEMEMTVLKLCKPSLDMNYDALLSRISRLESSVSGGFTPAKQILTEITAPLSKKSSDIAESVEESEPAVKIEDENISEPKQEAVIEPLPYSEIEIENNLDPVPETFIAERDDMPSEAPQSEPVENADPDSPVPLSSWPQVLEVLRPKNSAFHGLLVGSSAYVLKNIIYIKSTNPLLKNFLNLDSHFYSLKEALKTVTGTDYRPESYDLLETEDEISDDEGFSNLLSQIELFNSEN